MNRQKRTGERTSNGTSGTPLLAGLMLGGLVGTGTMLLLAPQSGRRTREEIQEGARDLRDRTTDSVKGAVTGARSRAEQLASDMRGKAGELQDQGRDVAIKQLDRVSSVAQARKEALQASKRHS